MPDVFISYSRRDSEFVSRLADAITEREREVWVDIAGIEDAEVFPEALRAAIENSTSFVYVITPDAAASRYCAQEVDYARELSKRIVPVLRLPVDDEDLPVEIRDRNWIPFQDDTQFNSSLDRLVAACDRDLAHAKAHTRWLVKALEWDADERDRSFLLSGSELTAAEDWLARSGPQTEPQPTELQRDYVLQSRRATVRRGRRLITVSTTVAVFALVLVVFALLSRHQAVTAKVTARAQALAATAVANLNSDPQISLVLSARAVREKVLPQSLYALRQALDASPLLADDPAPRRCASGAGLGASSATYNPTGTQLAIEQCDGALILRNGGSGAIERRSRVVMAGTGSVSYSPDGSLLAVGEHDAVDILSTTSLKLVRRLRVDGYPAVEFGPGGSSLLVREALSTSRSDPAAAGTLWRFNVETGQANELVRQPVVLDAAFAGHGAQVLVSTAGTIPLEVLDARSGRVEHRLATGGDPGDYYPVPLAVSPDGSTFAIAVATPQGDGQVQLWRTSDWQRVRVITSLPGEAVASVAFSPDSARVAVGEFNGSGGVWLASADERVMSFSGQTQAITALSFGGAGGSALVTTDATGVTRVWRAQGAEEFDVPDGFDPPAQVASICDDDDMVVVEGTSPSGRPVVRRWRIPGATLLGSSLLPAGSLPQVYDSASFADPATLDYDCASVLVPIDRGRTRQLRLVSLATRRTLATMPFVIYQTANFAPRDRRILVSDVQKKLGAPYGPDVELTPGSARELPLRAPHGGFNWASGDDDDAYSPDGRYVVVADNDGHVAVWKAASGQLVSTYAEPQGLRSLAVDPSDSEILESLTDGNATLRSLRSGRVIRSFVGSAGSVQDAEFSPDGRYVITISLDGTIRVWDADNGRQLREYDLPEPPVYFDVARNGSSIAVSDLAGVIRAFDICTDCENPKGLLGLAARRLHLGLTQRERAAIDTA